MRSSVEVTIADGNLVTVKGPKGTLTSKFHHDMIIKQEGAVLTVSRPDEEHEHKSLHGLTRTLLHNMIVGVEKGYTKELEVNGVGYRAQKQGKQLIMNLGYSHPVVVDEIDGITIDVPAQNKIVISGIDKQKVGQFAAARDRLSLTRARASSIRPRFFAIRKARPAVRNNRRCA